MSIDLKIAFLEQNSLKMGAVLFSKIEEGRQNLIYSQYSFPYITIGLGLLFFVPVAYFRNINSKLYKETALVLLTSGGCAYANVFYWRSLYYKEVNAAYFEMEKRMKARPDLYQFGE